MARDRQLALLFPGQGSQTADMRETVDRQRPDLLELALEVVGADLFERAADGTRWAQPAIFCAALAGAESARAATLARRPTSWPATRSARSPRWSPPARSSAEDGLGSWPRAAA